MNERSVNQKNVEPEITQTIDGWMEQDLTEHEQTVDANAPHAMSTFGAVRVCVLPLPSVRATRTVVAETKLTPDFPREMSPKTNRTSPKTHGESPRIAEKPPRIAEKTRRKPTSRGPG